MRDTAAPAKRRSAACGVPAHAAGGALSRLAARSALQGGHARPLQRRRRPLPWAAGPCTCGRRVQQPPPEFC